MQERFTYNDSVQKNYHDSFINLVNQLINDRHLIEYGLVNDEYNYDFIKMMNSKLDNNYEQIINKMNALASWWKSYNDGIDELKAGFVRQSFANTEYDNLNFKDAKRIIEENMK